MAETFLDDIFRRFLGLRFVVVNARFQKITKEKVWRRQFWAGQYKLPKGEVTRKKKHLIIVCSSDQLRLWWCRR